jgi:hypothetical protein
VCSGLTKGTPEASDSFDPPTWRCIAALAKKPTFTNAQPLFHDRFIVA